MGLSIFQKECKLIKYQEQKIICLIQKQSENIVALLCYYLLMRPAQPDQDNPIASETIQIEPHDPHSSQAYLFRSEAFTTKGNVPFAISDLSKSLFLDPTYEAYVRRGKLYASSSMFVYALMDFDQADKLYTELGKPQIKKANSIESKQEKQTAKFLEESIVVEKLPELMTFAKVQEKQKEHLPVEINDQFEKLMNQLINEKLSSVQAQQQKYNQLLVLVQKQEKRIQELEASLGGQVIDYQQIFYKEMEESTLSPVNKEKCTVYYRTLLSELEEYYLAAKVLHDIDEKKLKFQDYQKEIEIPGQTKDKDLSKTKEFINKLFKLFDKHSGKLERAGEIVKEIPYIGMAFKLIKSAVKGFSWFEGIKIENQCENILLLRPTVTSFNTFSARLAFEMYKYFKLAITTPKPEEFSSLYQHSSWEKIAKGYKRFRKQQIGTKMYKNLVREERDYINEMAEVHASIFMVGVAYGFFRIGINTDFLSQDQISQIFERMEEVEKKLLVTIEQVQEPQFTQLKVESLTESQNNNQRKICSLF